MNKNLRSAIYKSNKNDFHRIEYCGYLTPSEILELLKLNIHPFNKNGLKEWNMDKKKKGICNPTWFYFEPNKHFLELKERVMNEEKAYSERKHK